MRNDGGTFTNASSGLGDLPEDGVMGTSAADVDRDGDIDLYVPYWAPHGDVREDVLLLGDGNGTFTPGELPDARGAKTYQALFFDADGDGDPDLYATNDTGPETGGNVLFRNEGGSLADGADCDCAPETSGMSADAGDIDGDGTVDLYLGNSDAANLYLNDGTGSFVDAAVALGADECDEYADPDMVWGAVLLDHDNDADTDIFAAHGDLWAPEDLASSRSDEEDSLLSQSPDGTFEDVAPDLGLDSADSGRSVVAADHNQDGVLDLLVTNIVSDPHLWMSDGCTAAGWLEVELVGTASERHGVGARVEVEAEGKVQVGWATHASSAFAGKEPIVHFGLGEALSVDRLKVTWPSGVVQETTAGFTARRRVVVTEE
jgi:hypothetical protein